MAGSFELKQGANGQYHFNLKGGNGQIILASEMYEAKSSAETGIASVQANSTKDGHYKKEETFSGKFYFTLKAANHQVIGNSQMYASAISRDAGIESVKTEGATTVIKDNT